MSKKILRPLSGTRVFRPETTLLDNDKFLMEKSTGESLISNFRLESFQHIFRSSNKWANLPAEIDKTHIQSNASGFPLGYFCVMLLPILQESKQSSKHWKRGQWEDDTQELVCKIEVNRREGSKEYQKHFRSRPSQSSLHNKKLQDWGRHTFPPLFFQWELKIKIIPSWKDSID